MRDRHWNSVKQSESDEPLLVISKAGILKRERRTGKNLPSIDEVDAVVFEVLEPFRLVHSNRIYELYIHGARDAPSEWKHCGCSLINSQKSPRNTLIRF